jgi:MFS family permease
MTNQRSSALRSSSTLLLGMGLLMLGAGLQGTLVGLRATLEGFPTFVIGAVMSCYYIGYIGGSFGVPPLVQRVGHIRVFAALTAVASVTILLQGVFIEPITWGVLRFASGFCFAGIYIVAESWLNDRADNESRGVVLAVYMLVLYIGLGGGQFLLRAADPAGPMLFVMTSVLISLAVVPMSLSAQRAPEFQTAERIKLTELYRVSPLGVVGVVVSGVLTGALFSIGPVYARLIGFNAPGVSTFMGVSILAAVATQLPVGRLSDRIERRTVILNVCGLAAVFAALAAWVGASPRVALFALAACHGGLVLTLYSLSLSHINDHLEPAQMVAASASVIFLNGIGSVIGPILFSGSIEAFGTVGYFGTMAVLTGALAVYAIWRKRRRAPVPSEHKVPYVSAQPQAVSGQMAAETVRDLTSGSTPSRNGS